MNKLIKEIKTELEELRLNSDITYFKGKEFHDLFNNLLDTYELARKLYFLNNNSTYYRGIDGILFNESMLGKVHIVTNVPPYNDDGLVSWDWVKTGDQLMSWVVDGTDDLNYLFHLRSTLKEAMNALDSEILNVFDPTP